MNEIAKFGQKKKEFLFKQENSHAWLYWNLCWSDAMCVSMCFTHVFEKRHNSCLVLVVLSFAKKSFHILVFDIYKLDLNKTSNMPDDPFTKCWIFVNVVNIINLFTLSPRNLIANSLKRLWTTIYECIVYSPKLDPINIKWV